MFLISSSLREPGGFYVIMLYIIIMGYLPNCTPQVDQIILTNLD